MVVNGVQILRKEYYYFTRTKVRVRWIISITLKIAGTTSKQENHFNARAGFTFLESSLHSLRRKLHSLRRNLHRDQHRNQHRNPHSSKDSCTLLYTRCTRCITLTLTLGTLD